MHMKLQSKEKKASLNKQFLIVFIKRTYAGFFFMQSGKALNNFMQYGGISRFIY
jgi:hypothetical protein